MKEIQDEERRKKAEQQQAQEKETINAAVRRSHIEAVSKVFVFVLDHLVSMLIDLKTPTVTPGPTWTTVGANGKSSVTSPHVRPTVVVSSPSTPPLAARPQTNGAIPSPRSPAPAKVVTPVVKNEDTSANPSLDFLKWLTDSLKGLNPSVNRT
jgi:PERQ amino acid-rich with GYF domain-containing protein